MLPVYQAIQFEKEMEGGSTNPWLITVLKNGEPTPYVVKLCKIDNNEQNCTVLKECIGSILAQSFDLKTPEPALIEFSTEFTNTLNPDC